MVFTSWKKYRDFFANNKIDEDHFVLGIDLGKTSSAIAYFDPIRRNVEVLDISGGYGKASAPTAIQFDAEASEWIFGEYAILNANGEGALLTDFVGALGEYIDVGDNLGLKSAAEVCATYIKELVAACRAINPKAQIAGIIATIPDFVGTSAKQAMTTAFRRAGLETALIDLVEEREALLSHFLQNETTSNAAPFIGHALVLDYGARGLRGGVYDINHKYGSYHAECVCVNHNADLGLSVLDGTISDLFTRFYCENFDIAANKLSDAVTAQLLTFTHQHKDMMFQQSGSVRLYYNFPYPPFSRQVTQEQVAEITQPIKRRITGFVRDLLDKCNNPGNPIVVCTGGGFEMPWAKKHMQSLFNTNSLRFYKNSKLVLAEGAGFIAASRLGLVDNINLTITDNHKFPWDVGIDVFANGKPFFHPIIERGSWLWQKSRTAFVIAEFDANALPLPIDFVRRNENGERRKIGEVRLGSLPQRPPGTTKLAINITPTDIENLSVKVHDVGFGELFPATDMEITTKIKII